MGTHVQLGLSPCSLLRTAGFPCFSCGMTTAVTHAVHGNWLSSFLAQPMGLLIAIVAAVVFWAGLYIALTGRPSAALLNRLPWVGMTLAFAGLGVIAWGYKIAVVLSARP
jgi:hypothetical protein